jgi:Protein of unknown function (DUF2808)
MIYSYRPNPDNSHIPLSKIAIVINTYSLLKSPMRFSFWLGLTIATALSTSILYGFHSVPSSAVRLQDGKVYFVRPPSLVSAATTENRVSDSTASYFFTLTIPEDAGEPLGRVEIAQRDGSIRSRLIQFEAENSRAFIGTRRDRGEEITLGETRYDRQTQTLSIAFDPPVLPNTTITLELEPERNPRRDGIYLLGVTAYPAGAESYGQFLGYGRLQFDGSDTPFPISF